MRQTSLPTCCIAAFIYAVLKVLGLPNFYRVNAVLSTYKEKNIEKEGGDGGPGAERRKAWSPATEDLEPGGGKHQDEERGNGNPAR